MDYLNKIIDIKSFYDKGEYSNLSKLSSIQLLNISDLINDLFINDSSIIDPPNIVVVGTQSSGKSSTINNLIGYDVLPTGKSIVTRTPLLIKMRGTNKIQKPYVEFYEVTDMLASYSLDNELDLIKKKISELTIKYAGPDKNIINKPIIMKIYGPNLPNLSITDLPGLTNIALTDMGQSEDIKEQIENMIIHYISNQKTLILSIIQCSIDIESDMGLGLIKKYDKNFDRTIGILTKPDLIKSDVTHYLQNNMSKNLKLHYGYYVVNNSPNHIQYFKENPQYKIPSIQNRIGIQNVGIELSKILLNYLKQTIPEILIKIKNIETQTINELDTFGPDTNVSDSEKKLIVYTYISLFIDKYRSSVLDRGADINTGSLIYNTYQIMNSEIDMILPFDKNTFTDKEISNLITNYEGNHMPSLIINTGLIEKCFSNKVTSPINNILTPAKAALDRLKITVQELIDNIYEINTKFKRYPDIYNAVKEVLYSSIPTYYNRTLGKISELIEIEIECIYTDNPKFRNDILPLLYAKNNSNDIIRQVLNGYFACIKDILKHNIHKYIQKYFIQQFVDDLVNMLSGVNSRHDLIREDDTTKDRRMYLLELVKKIQLLKDGINSI